MAADLMLIYPFKKMLIYPLLMLIYPLKENPKISPFWFYYDRLLLNDCSFYSNSYASVMVFNVRALEIFSGT